MKKILHIISAVAALLLAGTVAEAQTISVHGVVKDAANGEALMGAAVQLEGSTTVYALTDAFGHYSINVPKDGVLNVSCLGFKEVSVSVNGRNTVDVSLEPDTQVLDETIVVAYGVQKKSSFVGSATQISGEKIEKMESSNITKSLEGAVAGLQTASSSGTPGSGASIQIRGFGSVNASTSPLIVVDGTPYEGSLNSISAQDIESLTVLKDAAANSMYGARGSNGVIIITTKRGTAGKVSVSFDAKVGVNSRAVPAYDVITDPGEYYEMTWEALRNAVYYNGSRDLAQAGIYASANLLGNLGPYNIYSGIADDQIVLATNGKLNPNASARNWSDDWSKDVFHSGIRQEYNMSATGGSDRTRGYLSLSYLNDEGYVPNSNFTRIAARAKVDHEVNKFISVGLNFAYANTDQNQYNTSESNNYSNLFMFAQTIAPIYPIYLYDANGNKQYDQQGNVLYDWGETGRAYAPTSNAFGQLQTSIYNTVVDNVSTRGYLNINLMKDLVFSTNIALDVFNTKHDEFVTPNGGDAANVNGRGEQEMDRYSALNANQLLTWSPSFGDHSLNVLLGHETKSDNSYYLYGHMTNFVNSNVSDFANAVEYNNLTSATSSYFLEGFFSRAEYDYAGKYYLSASYRMDGSSRFAKENRWGDFWSVGASWNAKGEDFLQNVDWVNFLKVKGSFGTQGNDNIGLSRVYENLYDIERVDGSASLTQTFRAAPDVTWEKSNNFNLGFESRLFGRVSFNFDYFIKETKDMIYYRPLAPSQGAPSSQLVNDMDMKNTGIEFEISADIVKTHDLVWNVSFNGTHYKNEITKLPSDYPAEGKQYGSYWREVGSSLYNYYLYEWVGVDPESGLPVYNHYDDEGNVTLVNSISEATYRKTGKTPIPDLYGGFSTAIAYKGFDFSAQFAYQIGGWTYDSVYQQLMTAGNSGSNWHKDIFNRWTPENTDTDVPRVQMNYQGANESSTRWLTSASYFSVKNITLGYTLPKHVVNSIAVENVRVYLTGDNLFYTSARKGMDVRKSFSGGNGFTYSALRTISGGVTLTF